MNILITDGENRSALAMTRSLGRKGCSVFVVGKDAENISACSKFCRKALATPDPLSDSNAYSKAIAEIVSREQIDLIFPMTEQSVYSLNQHRDQFGHAILACAPPEKMEAVSNKYTLFQFAEELGVEIPITLYVADFGDFQRQKCHITFFPVVVKPAFSKIQDKGKIISTGVMFAYNLNELIHLYETKYALRYPSMIQEMITGEGTGLFTLFDKDKHLVLFSHRRILEKPPSGGVSVLSESVPLDDEMVEATRKLLSSVQWTGIAMVEFKRDVRDGRAKLMEINGRFWGSLQLAVSSGIDFPALCLDYYLGKQPASVLCNYSIGHRLKWFFGILDHLIIRMKNNDSSFNLTLDTASKLHIALNLMKFFENNTSCDVYDRSDPDPFWFEARSYIRHAIRGRR